MIQFNFKTHIAIGFLAGIITVPIFNPDNIILYIILVLFSSLLPDIDHPQAKIGQHFKFIGYLFEHRGFFHSVFFVALVGMISYMIFGMTGMAYALVIGTLSHIAADTLNHKGIKLLHPVLPFQIKGIMKTGGVGEYIVFIATIVASGYLVLGL
ncbi:metal-dependent hydrolase [Nanoarchaeota archaeon]